MRREAGEVCRMPSGQRYHYGVHQERRDLYFIIFRIKTDARYYANVRNLVQELGGSTEWKRVGAGGNGTWTIELHGRNHRVPVRGLDTNDLARLYLRKVDEPRTSLDYGSPRKLQPDAFWRLVELFRA